MILKSVATGSCGPIRRRGGAGRSLDKGNPQVSLNYDIEVEVSGKEHQGKTTLVAYLSKLLTEAGAELIVQRADPQIDDKLGQSLEQLREKLAGKKIFLREIQTIL